MQRENIKVGRFLFQIFIQTGLNFQFVFYCWRFIKKWRSTSVIIISDPAIRCWPYQTWACVAHKQNGRHRRHLSLGLNFDVGGHFPSYIPPRRVLWVLWLLNCVRRGKMGILNTNSCWNKIVFSVGWLGCTPKLLSCGKVLRNCNPSKLGRTSAKKLLVVGQSF